MRLPKKLGFLPGGCVSALLLLLAFLQFQTQQQAYGLPEEWRTHFRVLLALSLALLLAIYLLPSRRGRLTACILRIVLFLITGIPFGRFLDVRYLMLFSVLLDINLALEGPLSLALSAGVLSCSAVFLLPLSVFSLRRPPPGPADLASFSVLGAALSGLLYCLRRLQRVNAESGQRVVALNDAVSRLIGANRDYLEYAARVARESTASERNRITLELHDVVGQAFTNIFAMMEASLKHPPAGQEEARGLHLLAREQAQKGLNETRAILYRLRSIEERELSGIHSLNNLVNTFSFSTKVKVRSSGGICPGRWSRPWTTFCTGWSRNPWSTPSATARPARSPSVSG